MSTKPLEAALDPGPADEVRLTPQRRAVLDVLQAADDHPTAADVLERVRAVLPGVGPATVYRTLALLVESGQAIELRLGQGDASRYDRNINHHDHLICDECGRVEDVRVQVRQAALRELAASTDFTVTSYDLRIHGRCAPCAATRHPQQRSSHA
jgi:Fur family ferric uptake transcriptional regulator/Fur family peroxide stress response transcriptional regulator